MADKPIKITFTLNDRDVAYFRRLLREARKYAKGQEPSEILSGAQALVAKVRSMTGVPNFATEAIATLETLVGMVMDKDYDLPKPLVDRVTAALAYFAQPEDLIPDHVPALGFLDDAIMVKIVEQEFEQELWGYRKFCRFRDGAEQRPWTPVARERLPRRLAEKRKEIRMQIDKRKARGGGGLW